MRIRKANLLRLLGSAFACALPLAVGAEPTLELRVSGPSEVFPGDPESTSVDTRGQVLMGPTLTEAASGDAPITALLVHGERIYAGTAGGGLDIYGPNRTSILQDQSSIITSIGEHQGQIYFATSPGGEIRQLTGTQSKPHFKPAEKYIWAILGNRGPGLLVATGEPGRILEVNAAGRAKVLFQSEETHLRTLLWFPRRGLIAGGGQKGIVYAIDEKNEVRSLYDSELEEVTDCALDSNTGDLYCAFISETKPGALGGADKTIGAVGDDSAEPSSPIKGSEVVRMTEDGNSEVVWSSRREGALALGFEPRFGRLLIATGGAAKERARVYAVETRDRFRVMLWTRVDAPVISALQVDAKSGAAWVGTAPRGKVLRLGPELRRESIYLSDEQDLLRASQVGRIWFDAALPPGASCQIELRSGNTSEVDRTWSPFSAAISTPEGGPITLPKARYVQFRARLMANEGGAGPVLKSLHASIVRSNVAPAIEEVFLLARGIQMQALPSESEKEKTLTLSEAALQRLRSASPEENETRVRQGTEPGMMTVAWRATDLNRDALTYRVTLRRLDPPGSGPEPYRELAKDLSVPFHSFDSRSFGDGQYQFRIEADDRAQNPPPTLLSDWNVSTPFRIDNTAPRLSALEVKKDGAAFVLSALASDATSLLGEAKFSVDGGPWYALPARDGLLDGREERLSAQLPPLSLPAPHTVTVRVTDEAGNEVTASTRFP